MKKRSGSKNSAGEPEKRSKLVIAPEKQLETIVNSDIFNPERAPNVSAWGRGRTQISLVGTFKVGKVEGAIILQQVSQRFRTPANTMGAMMTHDAMISMMSQVNRNAAAGNQNAQSGNARRPLGSMRQRWSMINPALAQQLSGNSANAPIKQYVRVGETLANGYTLTEVTRTKAVLTKGGDKMELELQDPSKNTGRGTTARRGSTWQQFQQTQLRTQQQMLRMMYMMQSRMNSGGGGGRGGRR